MMKRLLFTGSLWMEKHVFRVLKLALISPYSIPLPNVDEKWKSALTQDVSN
jgi:hypothetical protein